MTSQATIDPLSEHPAASIGDRLALAGTFSAAARRYWLSVFPHVRRELRHWRKRAEEIPDPVLRRLALDAQRKRGNVEGAAAFAAFAPRSERAALVRAVVAFQAAFDYLDLLAEQPQAEPVAGARGLHAALLVALDPAGSVGTGSPAARLEHAASLDWANALDWAARQPDYYAQYPQREDNGYLAELVDICRTALASLPSYATVAAAARRAAERIVEFQSCNLSKSQGDHDAFEQWARAHTPAGEDLRWWETAGGGGSPLCVYALIAAAADPVVAPGDVEAIEHAYFPWIGGLHSLLDHLVDRSQDAAAGQRSLIDYYSTPEEAAVRMQALAQRAVRVARALPRGRQHAIILAGMAGYYLSDPEASAVEALPIARGVREAIGGLLTPTLLVFKARRVVGRLTGFGESRESSSEALRGEPAAKNAVTVLDERDSPVALGFEP
jgi:tetraprenyl-beta-curcumene synthase